MTTIALQRLKAKTDEVEDLEVSSSIITSNYSGVHYDLYYPSNFSGSLVIFAGGILGDKQYSAGWATILVEAGYGVLTFSTKAEDLQHVARYVSNCQKNIQTLLPFVFNSSLFPISIDENAVSIVGMSGGGATVLALGDTRIKATVAICPYYINNSSIYNPSPVLIITGMNDDICPSCTGLVYYNDLEPDKMIIEQFNVGHDMNYAGWENLVAWLNYFVKNDASAYLTLTNVNDDPRISFSLSEFLDLPPA